MKNRMISVMLAAALSAAMLAGCGSSQASGADAADTADTQETAVAEASTEAASEAATEADEAATEAVTEEEVEELTPLEDIAIEETTLYDGEEVYVAIKDLHCTEDGAELTFAITNRSPYQLMVFARDVTVNGYGRDYGNSLSGSESDYWYLEAGESAEEVYSLYDTENDDDPTNYYALIKDPQRIRWIDVSFEAMSVEDFDENYYPLVDVYPDFIEVRTNIYDLEPEAEEPEGEMLASGGFGDKEVYIKFLNLYDLGDRYAWLFYADNQGGTTSLIIENPVVNGISMTSANPSYDGVTYRLKTDLVYSQTGLNVGKHGYVVMPILKSALEAAGVTEPITQTAVEFGCVNWDGEWKMPVTQFCEFETGDAIVVE